MYFCHETIIFSMHKLLLPLFISFFFFASCDNERWEIEFEENNFNFHDLETVDTLGIRVDISNYFLEPKTYQYLNNTALYEEKKDGVVSFVTGNYASVFLGIVKYTPEEVRYLKEFFLLETDSEVEFMHSYTRRKRIDAIRSNILLSEPQNLFQRTQKYGIVQSIEEVSKYMDNHYFFATIEFESNYYVFHFIANAEIAPYLFDDFLAMIKSVRK